MKTSEILTKFNLPEGNIQREATLTFSQEAIDVENRTVELVITTNSAVDRGGYFEQINLAEVDLSRVDGGVLPILENHDRTQRQIGRIISARIEGNALLGVAKFSRSQHADEVFQDIRDGIIQAFSIGMSVSDVTMADEDAEKPVLIFEGQFQELSVVGVPADVNAKVIGRSEDDTSTVETPEPVIEPIIKSELKEERIEMTIEKTAAQFEAEAKAERSRVATITKIAETYSMEGASRAIAEGDTVESFQEKALEKMVAAGTAKKAETREVELTKAEKKEYSLSRAVLAAGGHLAAKDAGIEHEVSRALVDAGNANAQGGLLIPCDMYRHAANPIMERASQQTIGTAADGGNLVATNFRADMFVDALYNNSAALGRVTVLSGLAGNVVIPTATGKHTGYWVAEDIAPTTSKMTFGQRTLSPKTLAAHGSMSLLTLRQNTPSIDALVRADLARIMGVSLDAGVFTGGGAGEPTGLMNFANIPTQVITNTATPDQATPTWAELVAFEQAIAEGNYPLNSLEWTVAPALITYLKTTLKAAGVSGYIMEGAEKGSLGYVNGYEVEVSTNVASDSSGLILGDMSQVVLGQFGQALEVITDRSATNGALEIGVFTVADMTVLNTAAFCKAVDA